VQPEADQIVDKQNMAAVARSLGALAARERRPNLSATRPPTPSSCDITIRTLDMIEYAAQAAGRELLAANR